MTDIFDTIVLFPNAEHQFIGDVTPLPRRMEI
jgi:hypothetical protein